MYELLQRFELRQIYLIAGGVLLLVGAALITRMLVPQIKDYRQAAARLEALEAVAVAAPELPLALEEIEADVAQLEQRLHGDAARLPIQQMEAYVLGRLQEISWANGIELVSVEPAATQQVLMFREVRFEVEVAGTYRELYAWLRALRSQIGFIVIKRFQIAPRDRDSDPPVLLARITMASYSPQ